MDILTGESLLDALETCDERPGTKIGIACAGREAVRDIFKALNEEICTGRLPGWRISTMAFGRTVLEKCGNAFADRSSIRIFNANDPSECRALSFHAVLYEDRLNEEVIQCLPSCERLHGVSISRYRQDEALTDFLDSFKII